MSNEHEVEYGYKPVSGTKRKDDILSFFLTRDFKPEERDSIINCVVGEIENYERFVVGRDIQTKYNISITPRGEVIDAVTIKSEDGIIDAVVTYKPPEYESYGAACPKIDIEINFNSTNPTDKEEYDELVKIVKKM